jgi:hypothetical protein
MATRSLSLGRALLAFLLLAGLCYASCARAHESRPAYLEINETVPDRYDVIWRTPLFPASDCRWC